MENEQIAPDKLALMQANEVMVKLVQGWAGMLLEAKDVPEKLWWFTGQLDEAADEVMRIGRELERES